MNMMKYCPECYKELPPESTSCPFCGYKPREQTEKAPDPETPKILKTPKIESYIPPEQTVLSLLLLVIFFWGINIAITVLPIFLEQESLRNILIAGISSQVLTRILIGYWAFEEQSLMKDQTGAKIIGAFLLTFVPIGGLFSFLRASKTMIRKERLPMLSISSIAAALIMSLMLFGTAEGITDLTSESEPAAVIIESLKRPTKANNSLEISSTAFAPGSARVYDPECRDPASVITDEEGDIIEVCGKVTNYGDIDCKNCPLGFYSFIKLDSTFQIISYDWRFTFAWLGDCMRVSDEVEILGDKPVFQFGKGEGYAGTECITDSRGELVCDGGIYFQDYFACDE